MTTSGSTNASSSPLSNEPAIAATPTPPYYAVIFTSIRNTTSNSDDQHQDYADTATRMMELARRQPGYLGVESVREESQLGITVSYWQDLDSIRHWKETGEHLVAQAKGQSHWYSDYTTRICRVERDYTKATTSNKITMPDCAGDGTTT